MKIKLSLLKLQNFGNTKKLKKLHFFKQKPVVLLTQTDKPQTNVINKKKWQKNPGGHKSDLENKKKQKH